MMLIAGIVVFYVAGTPFTATTMTEAGMADLIVDKVVTLENSLRRNLR